jgi:hypothetical protein
MNHTKIATLGMLAAIVVALAVLMVAATPLVTGHNAFAKSKVKVGNSKTLAIQAADNSQDCAFGAGSTLDTCTNTPTNNQTQTTNSGSTGAG